MPSTLGIFRSSKTSFGGQSKDRPGMGPGTEQEIQGFLAIARDEDTIGQVFRA
jgi:hypothetical protein